MYTLYTLYIHTLSIYRERYFKSSIFLQAHLSFQMPLWFIHDGNRYGKSLKCTMLGQLSVNEKYHQCFLI